MDSLWRESSALPAFERLDGDIKTDVLIIGGGMAGLLCAYMLQKNGVSYALAEAGRICGGVTGNTTAKITSQHGLLYDGLIRRFGRGKARMYLDANQAALGEFRRLCGGIDCDFAERDAYTYSTDDPLRIQKELRALQRLGFSAEFAEKAPLPFPIAGAVKFPRQAQFHPLKFTAAIAKDLNIYEHTPVRELIGTKAVTDRGVIRTNKIIVATHFPFLDKHGGYFLKMYQDRSYVLALAGGPDVGGMYVDEAKNGLSFRNHEDLLIIGGGGGRTGTGGGGWRALEDFAARQYPKARIKYRWATQDCMTLDSVPYIGPYASATKNLYVATGFQKWGMTLSMVAAMILSDMVQGKKNPYAPVFAPERSILRPQLAANAFHAVTGLLSPNRKRCPHLGCGLKWNDAERSWDCPCHGSRFTKDGRLLNNPAAGDLQ